MQIEKQYPAGALMNISDVKFLIEEARNYDIIIPLYIVGQCGYIETLNITKDFSIDERSTIYQNAHCVCSLLDNNLPKNRYNDHFMFTNQRHAENYSAYVKNSPEHEAATKAHWAYCDVLFRDVDMLYDDMFPYIGDHDD